MDFDELLPLVGELGSYQKWLLVLISAPACAAAAISFFSHIFISAVPEHHCKPLISEDKASLLNQSLAISENYQDALRSLFIPRDALGNFVECKQFDVNLNFVIEQLIGENKYINSTVLDSFVERNRGPLVKCLHGWEYDTREFSETMATKFNAVCDEEWMVSTAQSAYFFSAVIGSIVFGWISDKWGRRPALLLSTAVMAIGNLAGIFLPNYSSYVVMKFIVGLTNPTIFNLAFLLPAEIIGKTRRIASSSVCDLAFGLGMVLLACVAHFVHHWQALQAAISVPMLLLVSFYWTVPESPRWLMSQGRLDEAEVILQKIARVNGVPAIPTILRGGTVPSSTEREAVKEVGVSQLLQYPRTALKLVVMTFLWTATAMLGHGMSFTVTELPASTDVAFFLTSLFAVPGVPFAWAATQRFGRRSVTFWSLFLSGLFAAAEVFVPKDIPWLAVLLPSLSKFFSAVTFTVIYLYGGEVFPTVMRGLGIGVASMGSQLGLVITPYIIFLGRMYGGDISFAILGAIGCLGALSVLTLPETSNSPLPTTMEDSEHYSDYVRKNQGVGSTPPVVQ